MGTSTRLAIRQAMGKAIQLYRGGTATGGTTSTLIDTTNRKERDDFWNGSECHFEDGANAGVVALVSDFVQSTSTSTLAQSITQPSVGNAYGMYLRPFKVQHYNDAISAALDEAYSLGFARRGWDETLWTTRRWDYDLPTTLEEVAEVHVQAGPELAPDNDWGARGSGWTVHSVGSFTNDGDTLARTLKHTITQADQYTTTDIAVQPLVKYAFRVRVKGDGTAAAKATYQFLDTSGTLIGSATSVGTSSSTTSAILSTTFQAPSNAQTVRISLGSASASGAVYFWEVGLRQANRWTKLPRGAWEVEWEGTTGRLIFRERPRENRVLRLKGRRALEALSADSDTLSFDAPESRAFICLALAHLWAGGQGPVPDVDRNHAETQERLWRQRYARMAGGLFDNFRQQRSAATPVWV